ncbi:MAG TPA: hypothetical protein PKN86_05990, partial [Candidatus Obscuribacter sp.]|nr:hypothetical protein [Candidatus Obscuribacter sp.]
MKRTHQIAVILSAVASLSFTAAAIAGGNVAEQWQNSEQFSGHFPGLNTSDQAQWSQQKGWHNDATQGQWS